MIPTDKLFKCNCHNRLSSTQGMVTSLSHGSYILCSSTHLTTIVMALNPYIAVSLKIQKRKCINIDFTFEPDVWNLLRIISVILVAFSTICLLLTIIFYLTFGYFGQYSLLINSNILFPPQKVDVCKCEIPVPPQFVCSTTPGREQFCSGTVCS